MLSKLLTFDIMRQDELKALFRFVEDVASDTSIKKIWPDQSACYSPGENLVLGKYPLG